MTLYQTRRKFLRSCMLALPLTGVGTVRLFGATVKRPLPSVDLSFLPPQIKLMRRSKWTKVKAKTWLLRASRTFDRLTVHHAGSYIDSGSQKNSVIRDLDNILVAHLKRSYGDIGYHFIVDGSGCVWEGRSLSYEGAHVSNENEKNIGVMLLGNFEEQNPSDEQIGTMTKLSEILCKKYRIERHKIYGHRDLGASVCPGKNLYPQVKELKKKLKNNKQTEVTGDRKDTTTGTAE